MLIAFIPPYILMDLETKNPQYWDRKNDNISKNALLVLRMLYSTNTIVNPFIYGFLTMPSDGSSSQSSSKGIKSSTELQLTWVEKQCAMKY